MEKQELSLLAIWRAVSRHVEIHELATQVAEIVRTDVPLSWLSVWQLDMEHQAVLPVASVTLGGFTAPTLVRMGLTAAQRSKLLSWCKRGELTHVSGDGARQPAIASVLPQIAMDSAVVPLLYEGVATGLLFVAGDGAVSFSMDQLRWIDGWAEPFAVALENDRRIHELARLREAAEAERGVLLRRLGRSDLSDTIVGEETGLRQVIERIELVSKSDVPVLVLGETGTGKELVARAIHARGGRQAGAFIRVNCGAIPAELVDSQLFGHERGSFTGADQKRAGWFERADGGTLFLDEIGELPLEAQVRFLRVLQDGFVERVGGNHSLHVDVRIVAATHRDLAQMVRDGKFREDLWYRLAVFPIMLPPLRDRRDDIPALAHHFAERAALRFGLPFRAPTSRDIRLLQTYEWPGNIRELGVVIDRAVILGNGDGLDVVKALGLTPASDEIEAEDGPGPENILPWQAAQGSAMIMSLDDAMRTHIIRALRRTLGRIEGRRGTAALLGINPHTLRARMRKLGIDWQTYRI